jgi:hypothetical protein
MSLPPDDERTVLASSLASTGPAGTPAPAAPSANALAVGTRLGEFEITGLLGEGGFGIVYLAYDSSLERHVALKEYMPSSFASRSSEAQVAVQSERYADTFQAGLRSFVNEARILAQFDHPSLIKVYRFWEANGTAYMVMPYYQGLTLKQALLARSEPPDEAWLKVLLAPLLDTLGLIHEQQCFHRDIAPDNIMMLDSGRPLLLDFGAARRAISGMQQAFTVIFKQGYAPIEQYAELPGMSQGAWTDLFALASVVHFAIAGSPPPPAVGRMMSDPYVPLATRYADRFSNQFLTAIDRALSVKPEERPQSAAELRALLGLTESGGIFAAQGSTLGRGPLGMSPGPTTQPKEVQAPAVARSPRRRTGVTVATIFVAIATASFAGYALFYGKSQPAAQVAGAPALTTGVHAISAPALTASAGVGGEPAGGVSVVTSSAATPAATLAPALLPAPAEFEPLAALNQVVAGASEERAVTVSVEKSKARIGKDSVNFSVQSAHAGYLYVQMVGSDRNNFWLLFPNAVDKNNYVKAGQTVALPRKSWRMGVEGPAGVDHFVAIVSDVPRDFGSAGLVSGGLFSEFPIARARELQRAYAGKTPLFAGSPSCPPAAANARARAGADALVDALTNASAAVTAGECSSAYGASTFSIEETAP